MKKLSYLLIAIVATLSIISPITHVFAQYELLEPLPNLSNPSGGLITTISFGDYVAYMFNFLIALSAVAAVFMIVLGGFQYMTTDSWGGKTAGLDKAKNALLGLLLILSSYILLRAIDPRFVNISSTLVKPLLTVNYKVKHVGPDYKGQLQEYDNKARDLNNQNSGLTNDIDKLESDRLNLKQDIQNEANTDLGGGTDEEISRYCATQKPQTENCKKFKQNLDTESEKKATLLYNNATKAIDKHKIMCDQAPNDRVGSTCSERITAVTNIENDYTSQLSAAGNPDKAAQVHAYAKTAKDSMTANINADWASKTQSYGGGRWGY